MTPRETEADARIAIDDLLRQAGWDPSDKSMVAYGGAGVADGERHVLIDRSRRAPLRYPRTVYDLTAAAGTFGPDRTVGTAGDEIGWIPVSESFDSRAITSWRGSAADPWSRPSRTAHTASSGPIAAAAARANSCSSGIAAQPIRSRRRVLCQEVREHEGRPRTGHGAIARSDSSPSIPTRRFDARVRIPTPKVTFASSENSSRSRASRGAAAVRGRADYVLYAQSGRPLAIIEAKKNAIHPYVAKQQALPYAQALGAPVHLPDQRRAHLLLGLHERRRPHRRARSSPGATSSGLSRCAQTRKPLATIDDPRPLHPPGRDTHRSGPTRQEAMRALDRAVELGKRRFLIELPNRNRQDGSHLPLPEAPHSRPAGPSAFSSSLIATSSPSRPSRPFRTFCAGTPSYWLRPGMAAPGTADHGLRCFKP